LEIKKIISSHTHAQDLGTRDVFKIYDEHPHPFSIGVHPILEVLPKITSTCFPHFSCSTLIYQHLAEFLEVGILVFDPHAIFPFPLQAMLSLSNYY